MLGLGWADDVQSRCLAGSVEMLSESSREGGRHDGQGSSLASLRRRRGYVQSQRIISDDDEQGRGDEHLIPAPRAKELPRADQTPPPIQPNTICFLDLLALWSQKLWSENTMFFRITMLPFHLSTKFTHLNPFYIILLMFLTNN